jgi:hypothetical protein
MYNDLVTVSVLDIPPSSACITKIRMMVDRANVAPVALLSPNPLPGTSYSIVLLLSACPLSA